MNLISKNKFASICIYSFICFFSVGLHAERWKADDVIFKPWNGVDYKDVPAWGWPLSIVTNDEEKIAWVVNTSSAVLHGWGDYVDTNFTPNGQIVAKKSDLCFSTDSDDSYVRMQKCSDDKKQKFRYLIDGNKLESIKYPGRCITFGYTDLYHGMAYGNLYLGTCNTNSTYTQFSFKYGANTGVGASGSILSSKPIPSPITTKIDAGPHAGETHTYEIHNGVEVDISDWRYAHFMVPQSMNDPIDCSNLRNPQGPVSLLDCRSAVRPMTCTDYNNAATANTGINNHYNFPLQDVQTWWNKRESYLQGTDVIINAGWFDVTRTNEMRMGPIPYNEACTGSFGLLSSDGNNLSHTNAAVSANGSWLGNLDALIIRENTDTSSNPAYTKDVFIMDKESVYTQLNSDLAAGHTNAISGVLIARNGEVLQQISDVAKPNSVVARTLVGLGSDHNIVILVVQNAQLKDNIDTPKIHRAGIDLYAAASWMLLQHPKLTDIIALDGSGSSQVAVTEKSTPFSSQFHRFKDKDGNRVITTLPGDIVGDQARNRPVPQVLMIDANR